jgi:hypothetical protein
MHCRFRFVFFFYNYIPCNFCLILILFTIFSSSNLYLIVLKMMITKDMITACVVDFLLFALFSSIGLFRR